MKKIVLASISFLSVLVLCTLLIAFSGIRIFGVTPYITLGSSMEPAIHVGSVVYVRDTPFDEIQVGDCVTWNMADGNVCTHRVIQIDTNNRTLSTKGDANSEPDSGVVSEASVLGTVAFCVPSLGYLAQFMETQPHAALGIALVLTFVSILPELYELHLTISRRRKSSCP